MVDDVDEVKSARHEVGQWLRFIFAEHGGTIELQDLLTLAKAKGYRRQRLDRARKGLPIESVRLAVFPSRTLWVWRKTE